MSSHHELRAAALLQEAAAAALADGEEVRAVWPLVQINVWGFEQVRVLAVTPHEVVRLRVRDGVAEVCERCHLRSLKFLVKGHLYYPRHTLVHALGGGDGGTGSFAFRLYYAGQEEHRTFRWPDGAGDDVVRRTGLLAVIDELRDATRSAGNSQFFIADHDITLSARLGPFALLTNRLRPPSVSRSAPAVVDDIVRAPASGRSVAETAASGDRAVSESSGTLGQACSDAGAGAGDLAVPAGRVPGGPAVAAAAALPNLWPGDRIDAVRGDGDSRPPGS